VTDIDCVICGFGECDEDRYGSDSEKVSDWFMSVDGDCDEVKNGRDWVMKSDYFMSGDGECDE
jgi:hypothetical protein